MATRFFNYRRPDGTCGVGVEIDRKTWDLTAAYAAAEPRRGELPRARLAFCDALLHTSALAKTPAEEVLERARKVVGEDRLVLKDPFAFEPPVVRPGKIIALARTFAKHAKEEGQEIPQEPVFFLKPPSSLLPAGGAITIPSWVEGRVVTEGEIAAIVGRTVRDVHEEDALGILAGYTLLNDVTARDLQRQDAKAGLPWSRAKGIHTFCPCGPYMVPAESIPDPHELELHLSINGKKRQEAKLQDLLFSIPRIVSEVSRYLELEPGDILSLGTPPGSSPIKHGDVVEITCEPLGKLRNPVQRAANGSEA